jgi:hypothetical protein
MSSNLSPFDSMDNLAAIILEQLRTASTETGIPASRIHIPTSAHDPISRAARAARNKIWHTLRQSGHPTAAIAAAFRVEHSTVRHTLCTTRKKATRTNRYIK